MTRSVRGRSRPRSSITMATRGLSRISTGAVVAKCSQAGRSPEGVWVSGRGGSIAVCVDGSAVDGLAGAGAAGDGPVCVSSEPAPGASAGRLLVAVPPPALGGNDTATGAEPGSGDGISQATTPMTTTA